MTKHISTRKQFIKTPTCIADLWDKYIKVGERIFFVRRINDFGDASLKSVSDTEGLVTIANIRLTSRKNLTLGFMYHGFPSEAKIKFSEIRYAEE